MHAPHALLSRCFQAPARPLRAVTADGVSIVGSRLGEPGTDRPALVLCHGLLGWHRKPGIARFAERMARWFAVYAIDLRGHGGSGGLCTYGDREIEDVEAAVSSARRDGHRRVVTVGMSLGGIAVIRHAGLIGGVDAAVAISSPARWRQTGGSTAWRRLRWLTDTPLGRRVGRRALGVRLPDAWEAPESPEEVVGKIAPVPVIIVHGRDDHLIPEEEAWRLYQAAGEPRRLLLAGRFGHAEVGCSPQIAGFLARRTLEALELPWPG